MQEGLLGEGAAAASRAPAAAAAQPAPQGEFHLVRYFTITSLVAFVVVAAVLAAVFRHISIQSLLRTQEDANVNITRVLANELWVSDFGPFVHAMSGRSPAELKAAPQIPRLHARVLGMMRGSSVFKVKVYDLNGMTVYSTELAQVGEDKRGNAGVVAASQGRVLSELVYRNSFSALEQQVLDRNLIQSYIPAYDGGRIGGVFEVYSDATPFVAEIVRRQWLVAAAVVALLATLYAALFFVVNRAQGIIRRQGRARYREFIAKAAHELRTPMTGIYGFAALLKSRRLDAEATRDVVDTLHEQAGRLVHLSNELLDLSRLEERGVRALVLESHPLAPLLEEAAAAHYAPGEARRVQLEVEPRLPAVRIDRAQMAQVLANLLSNAHKFSAAGTPVGLRAFREGASVGIRVTDRGIGMSQEELAHVFDRFWRAERASDVPGSGLGMALVREIVELHGGTIEITSAPGAGTTVTVRLPC